MDSPARTLGSTEISSDAFCLTATRPEEAERVARFLAGVFREPLGARSLSPAIFRWKYFAKRPDWNQPRSYLLRENDAIAAHIGVWPIRFRGPSGHLTGIGTVDWAASRAHPGAGSRLRLGLQDLADFEVGIGGTAASQRARPKLGFRPWGTLSVFQRVIRPWLKYRRVTAGSGLRRFGRLGLDLFHAARPFATVRSEWTADTVKTFDESLDGVLSLPDPGEVRSYRTAAALNYFLSCPDTDCTGLVFRHQGLLCGSALLSRVGGQVRIAALWARDDWESAYQLATEIAAQDPTVYEIIAGASSVREETALKRMGYRVRNTVSIAVKDNNNVISSGLRPCIQLVDSDAFFL